MPHCLSNSTGFLELLASLQFSAPSAIPSIPFHFCPTCLTSHTIELVGDVAHSACSDNGPYQARVLPFYNWKLDRCPVSTNHSKNFPRTVPWFFCHSAFRASRFCIMAKLVDSRHHPNPMRHLPSYLRLNRRSGVDTMKAS